jgi:hypothetical protein
MVSSARHCQSAAVRVTKAGDVGRRREADPVRAVPEQDLHASVGFRVHRTAREGPVDEHARGHVDAGAHREVNPSVSVDTTMPRRVLSTGAGRW